MTGNLRDTAPRPERARRDPTGKRALFSAAPEAWPSAPAAAEVKTRPTRAAPRRPPVPPRPGTVVIECSACDRRTRIRYLDFALLNLPVGLWLPIPGRRYNRRMTCPACNQWAWVRAAWLE